MKDPHLLIDCNALCYRGFYTLQDLSVNDVPINVVFSFLRQVLTLSRDFNTEKIIFCWDSRVNLRKEIYPDYKRKRREDKTKEEVAKLNAAFNQFTYIRRIILPRMGFNNIFIQSGFEADDVIAAICKKQENNYVIVSADSDLIQLLDDNVKMYNFKKVLTKKWFEDTHKCHPKYWANAKAIGGCESDNVKGIKGISDPSKSKAKEIPALLPYSKNGSSPKTKKILEKIAEEENKKIIDRNFTLVNLPFRTGKAGKYLIKDFSIEEDDISINKFKKVFIKHQFESFIRPDQWTKWVEAFRLE